MSGGKLYVVAENHIQASYFAQCRSLGFTDWRMVASDQDLRGAIEKVHLVEGWERHRDAINIRRALHRLAAAGTAITGSQAFGAAS